MNSGIVDPNRTFGRVWIILSIAFSVLMYGLRMFFHETLSENAYEGIMTLALCTVLPTVFILFLSVSYFHGLIPGGSLLPMIVVVFFSFLAIASPMPTLSIDRWLENNEDLINNIQSSPNGEIIAVVVSEDCGVPCTCRNRIDLLKDGIHRKRIWSAAGIWNVELSWKNNYELVISSLQEEFPPIRRNMKDWGM